VTISREGKGWKGSLDIDDLQKMDGFRLDIQAMRGLAVLLVVLYHARIAAPGGFVGVDVFFVISGFVIGRLLVSRLSSAGTVSFRNFYERRARRLLPALGATLAVVSLVAPLLAPIGASIATTRTAVAAASFSANGYLYWAAGGGYFAPSVELNPLLHTWSLSVEEQFYFGMPVALVLVWKLGVRRNRSILALRAFAIVVVAASLAACVFFSFTDSIGPLSGLRFAFFSPVTRAWEFAVGFGIVLVPRSWFASLRLKRAAVAAGLGLVCLSAFVFSDSTVFPGVAALVPVLGTAMVIFGGTDEVPVWRPLTKRVFGPMVRLGDLSYGWYLWHWPFIVFAGAYWPNAGRLPLLAAAVLSLGPAVLSYRFLERHFRANPTTRPAISLALAVTCIAIPLVSVAIARQVDIRLPASSVSVERSEPHLSNVEGCDEESVETQRQPGDCTWGSTNSDTSIALVGDSNAGHFSETFIGAAKAASSGLRIETRSGCPFIDAEVAEEGANSRQDPCKKFVDRLTNELEEQQPSVVFIANSTDLYLEDDSRTLVDPITKKLARNRHEEGAIFQAGLERMSAKLAQSGMKVVIVEVPPKPRSGGVDFDPDGCSPLLLWTDAGSCTFPDFGADQPTTAEANRIEREAARATSATTWSFSAAICPEGQCSERNSERPVWSDGDHISVGTAKSLIPKATAHLQDID
jgi:peptidoglycan/LPS O-acetylase OafA/YrhL